MRSLEGAGHKIEVLLSAYACEPGKGSEHGVGWSWVCGLADRTRLTVLTREAKREVIERAVAESPVDSALRSVKFVYYDLGRMATGMKKWGLLPTVIYYIQWQWSACRKFKDLANEMEVVHHLTFCTLLCPGFWRVRKGSYVLGPVGAPEVDPQYLPLFGPGAIVQRIRSWCLVRFLRLPWLRCLLENAKAVVPANSATRRLLVSRGVPVREVMLDTGAPETQTTVAVDRSGDTGCRFVFAGSLVRRKGLELSLRAFAEAAKDVDFIGEFLILGDGPDRPRLERLTEMLGLRRSVTFAGEMPHEVVKEQFRTADVFLFSSIRDTSAGVNLEAMACGLPVVCLNHQGVADITTDACAIRVQPGTIEETIKALAEAIARMEEDSSLRKRLGKEARRRAMEDFSWGEKFDRMVRIYRNE